jgi:CubicO group peptidase (beta-lactamase class C family)
MESPGFWIADSQGMEMAFAGLLMTARDFAKLGELYRNRGVWQGRQIVPADYVAASVVSDAPHLAPGKPMVGGHAFPLGYGLQWWLPAGECGEFSAIGVYNQYVYVDPSRGVVIVKLSANPRYGTSHDDEDNKDAENIYALRAVCRQFD